MRPGEGDITTTRSASSTASRTLCVTNTIVFRVRCQMSCNSSFGWLGLQLLRFSKPPTIAVTSPAVAVLEVDEDATSYLLEGTTIAGGFPQTVLDSLLAADSHTVVIRRDRRLRSTPLSRLAREPDAVARGDLGIALNSASSTAAVISDVRPGSAAASAGLRAGDRLIRVGSTSVGSAAEARRLLDRLRINDSTVFLVFVRDSVARGVLVRR